MGRPRLYFSPEEKAKANRAKNKKYYEKHKHLINKRRQKKYSKQSSATGANEQQDRAGIASTRDPLIGWMEDVERIHNRLVRLVGCSPQEYVDKLAKAFLDGQDEQQIRQDVERLSAMQTSIYRFQNEIYALTGVGSACERAAHVVKEISEVLKWVEELLYYVMCGGKDFRDHFQEKKFMYQCM